MKKIILLCLLVAGCTSTNSYSRIAVLQNPESKQTVECRVDPWGSFNTKGQVDTCVATYQKAGYKLVADSAQP